MPAAVPSFTCSVRVPDEGGLGHFAGRPAMGDESAGAEVGVDWPPDEGRICDAQFDVMRAAADAIRQIAVARPTARAPLAEPVTIARPLGTKWMCIPTKRQLSLRMSRS